MQERVNTGQLIEQELKSCLTGIIGTVPRTIPPTSGSGVKSF
jgi:hypothetical protein